MIIIKLNKNLFCKTNKQQMYLKMNWMIKNLNMKIFKILINKQ